MIESTTEKNNRQVAAWLMLGVLMIIIQVLIGGITRLTESGLSITEWKPITGALPPLNDAAWQVEFEKYRGTDQFKYVHPYFSLKEFKYIFFWEWFHRLWARLLGVVFLIGFIYFVVRKKITRRMIAPLVLLFLLGGLQGAIGWLMVKSGLVPEKFFVGHVELTTHLIAALILLSYTCWFAISLLPAYQEKIMSSKLKNLLGVISILFFLQLIYGGFMAGLKAAAIAPTWPDINGKFVPSFSGSIISDPLAVHFIHRGIAYLLLIFVSWFYFKSKVFAGNKKFNLYRNIFLALIFIQALLGIFAVLNATNPKAFVFFGVAHQFVAMLLVICITVILYLVNSDVKQYNRPYTVN
ncbi:MAG: COX15/CtaA family protein [Ferruginibacter sp.]